MDRGLDLQRGYHCRKWPVGTAYPGLAQRKMANPIKGLERRMARLFGPDFLWNLPLAFSDLAMAHGKPNGRVVAFGLHSGIELDGGQFVLPIHGKTALGQTRSTPMRAMALTVQYAIFQASLHV